MDNYKVYSVIDLTDDQGIQVLTKNKEYEILSDGVEIGNTIKIKCDAGDERNIHMCCFTTFKE